MTAPATTRGPSPAGTDAGSVLRAHLRRTADPVLGSLPYYASARVVWDAGDEGLWTLRLSDGLASVHRGREPASAGGHRPLPQTTLRSDAATLTDIACGQTSGIEAFLDGRVTVRGDLALSLLVEGVLSHADTPDRWPRSGVVTARGIRTVYLEAGPRTGALPVVALHGLGASNASLLPTIWDLAEQHRVLAPDLPGFGATGKPRHGGYDPAWYARWLEAFLDATGTGECVVLGNSLGGRVALEAGLRMPDRVRGLVLYAPSPAFRRLRQWVPVVRLLRPGWARLPVPMTHAMVVEGMRTMFSVPERLPQTWYDAAADEFMRVWQSPRARVAFFSAARQIYLEHAFGADGFWTRLPTLVPPALFVWGARDRLVPASFARHVVDAVPRAQSVVLDDCGHVPQFELPEATNLLTREFLAGLS